MDYTWDLSIFYQGFDDPAIEKDLNGVKELIAKGNELLLAGEDQLSTLEKIVDVFESIAALSENLGCFANLSLTCLSFSFSSSILKSISSCACNFMF